MRRRLDLERPVDNQMLLDCIDLAEQAPTGGNLGSRRWIIVRDQAVKEARPHRALPPRRDEGEHATHRRRHQQLAESGRWHRVP
ncbi:MAG: hypothetical protein ABW122_03325 [Ilumatobacteraceae bacterium]